jgi:hypothetical protein
MKRTCAIFLVLMSLLLGVATSHAALYFPHFDTRTGQWQTEICIINPGSELVIGNLETYSTAGTLLGTETLLVSAYNRKQISVGTELTYAGNTTGYLVFKNTTGAPVGYTKFTQTNGDRVAIPASDAVTTGDLYLTHIAWAPWWTGISLVNTTNTAKTLTFRFNTGKTKQITLGARQQYVNLVSGLNDNTVDTAIESAVIEGASGVVGLELFGNGSQLGGVPLISQMASTLYYPHVDTSTGWWTGIVAYNPSTTATAQATIKGYNTGGTLVGTSTRQIGPRQKFVGYPSNLNLPATTAWFSIESPNPLVGFELFGNASPNYLAGYSVVNLEGKSGIFPKLEKGAGGWTGIAFVNTENQSATVSLKAYNDTGNIIATGTKALTAHQKWVGMVADLFAGTNLNSATYLTFTSDRNVAGFQLNSAGAMLDALQNATPSGQRIIDQALGLLQFQSSLSTGGDTLTAVLNQITSGTNGGTCPAVTTTPPLTDLTTLPPSITFDVNYGTGCTAADGSTMSGKVVLAITNLTAVDPNINLDYAMTGTNMKQNGDVVLNGSLSGHITLTVSGTIGFNMTAHFNNFQAGHSTISGDMTIGANNLNIADITGGITITLTNLTVAGYTVTSGTLTISASTGSNASQLVANLNTSQGPVTATMTVTSPTDTRYVISTTTAGSIAGYAITINNLTMDSNCSNNPLAGTVTVAQGGSTVSRTFNATCTLIPATPVAATLQEIPRQITRILAPRESR